MSRPSSKPLTPPAPGDDSDAPQANIDVYKYFGRDTAAGRAMYNIYNKGKTPYNPNVKITVNGRIDPAAQHRQHRLQQAQAAAPKPYVDRRVKKVVPPPKQLPSGGKKRADIIAHEMAISAASERAPVASHMPSRDQQKQQLQDAMENAGKSQVKKSSHATGKTLPAPTFDDGLAPDEPRKPGLLIRKPLVETKLQPSRDRHPNDSLQELFDKISGEIADREEFLAEMDSLGQKHLYEAQIQAEIAQRVMELKKLDAQMKG